LSDCK